MMPPFLFDLFKNQSYNPNNFFLIAGPCAVKSEDLVMEIA
jgi:2-dehydro-3-deoxyphosphooctonate aldolase (KDO 8-P synthase)